MGNKSLFNPLNVRASLYVFENSYQEVEGGQFKQRRRSLPLEPLVFDALPEMLTKLTKFIRTKLLAKKAEIRLALVFKTFSIAHKRRLEDRVRQILIRDQSQSNDFGA